jgi:hypothetical protein
MLAGFGERYTARLGRIAREADSAQSKNVSKKKSQSKKTHND